MDWLSVADSVAMVEALAALCEAIEVALSPTAVGAAASIVRLRSEDAEETLLAASVALAVTVWSPAESADDVIDQLPPVAVAVPSTVVPSVSYSVMVLPLSAVPEVMSGVEGAAGAV